MSLDYYVPIWYYPQHRRKLNTYKNIHKINILHLFKWFYTIPFYLPSFPPNCKTFLHFFFNLKNQKIKVCIQYYFHWVYALCPKSWSVLDTGSIFWTLFMRAEHWAFFHQVSHCKKCKWLEPVWWGLSCQSIKGYVAFVTLFCYSE